MKRILKETVRWVLILAVLFVIVSAVLGAFGYGQPAPVKRYYRTEAQATAHLLAMPSWGGLDLTQYDTGILYPDKYATCSGAMASG